MGISGCKSCLNCKPKNKSFSEEVTVLYLKNTVKILVRNNSNTCEDLFDGTTSILSLKEPYTI